MSRLKISLFPQICAQSKILQEIVISAHCGHAQTENSTFWVNKFVPDSKILQEIVILVHRRPCPDWKFHCFGQLYKRKSFQFTVDMSRLKIPHFPQICARTETLLEIVISVHCRHAQTENSTFWVHKFVPYSKILQEIVILVHRRHVQIENLTLFTN